MLASQRGQFLDRSQHARRSVHVRHGHELGSTRQCRFDGGEFRHVSHLRADGFHLRAVAAQDVGHARGKVAGVHDDGAVARLDDVCHSQLHRQRPAAGHDERLPVGRGKDIAQIVQALAERFDKACAGMAHRRTGHRRQYLAVHFDGAGDHQ